MDNTQKTSSRVHVSDCGISTVTNLFSWKADKWNYNNVTKLPGAVFSFGHSVQFCYYSYRITWYTRPDIYSDSRKPLLGCFSFSKTREKMENDRVSFIRSSWRKGHKSTPNHLQDRGGKRFPPPLLTIRIMLTQRFFSFFEYSLCRVWGILLQYVCRHKILKGHCHF